ncbi:hypothetical protein [Phenylobacterium sp.]|nr:hypothetical protein [Phenylobacterium sp.]
MSKPVVVSIPHELGRVEARRRIEEGVGNWAASRRDGASRRVSAA